MGMRCDRFHFYWSVDVRNKDREYTAGSLEEGRWYDNTAGSLQEGRWYDKPSVGFMIA